MTAEAALENINNLTDERKYRRKAKNLLDKNV